MAKDAVGGLLGEAVHAESQSAASRAAAQKHSCFCSGRRPIVNRLIGNPSSKIFSKGFDMSSRRLPTLVSPEGGDTATACIMSLSQSDHADQPEELIFRKPSDLETCPALPIGSSDAKDRS